ncbi:hypothetical protein AB5J52_40430 [Streptomyces sp. R39]|uniref:Uncharacterized protein n=1 Tax=Streptomyces sp. R39 TaxID=3238631 RepID=A0AB39R0X5_9ACTN
MAVVLELDCLVAETPGIVVYRATVPPTEIGSPVIVGVSVSGTGVRRLQPGMEIVGA